MEWTTLQRNVSCNFGNISPENGHEKGSFLLEDHETKWTEETQTI